MDVTPAVVSTDLAIAAAATHEMVALYTLADWIGEGKGVTDSGVLRPALVPEICALLDIDLPDGRKVRSALDIEPLNELWEVAREAGLVSVGPRYARARVIPQPSADPEGVLRIWLDTIFASFSLNADDLCAECLSVLAILADATEPVRVMTLLEEFALDFTMNIDAADEDELESVAHAISTVKDIEIFGAASLLALDDLDKATAELTPLGQMLADTVFAALTVPADELVEELVDTLAPLSPRTAGRITARWLAARSVPDAAAELLDFASYARADLRMVATELATTLGDQAASAWRERVRDPGVGVYARTWLARRGEPAILSPRDEEWMEVERLSAHIAGMPQKLLPAVFAEVVRSAAPDQAIELQRLLHRSRHPDAPTLTAALNQALGRPALSERRTAAVASVATGKVHQLHVSLRYVDDPPVWRQLAVDAGTSLADLHLVIQAAMGWQNDHLYRFVRGRQVLAEILTVGQVLPRRGSRLQYIYDFGDDWEHDIAVADVGHADGVSVPALVSGSGACPPEDCGGAPGYLRLKEIMADPEHDEHDEMADWVGTDSYDAAAFSVAEAQALVRQCSLFMTSARTPATVIRTQPRGRASRKKRKPR